MQKKYYILTVAIALIMVILLLVWFAVFFIQLIRPNQVIEQQKQSTTTPNTKPTSTTNASLGSQIYQKTQNPLQKKLPDTNPVKNANPIQGAYTNPF